MAQRTTIIIFGATGDLAQRFARAHNWRWRGVPFYLRTGKSMAEKTSEIVIQFQRPPHVMFSLDHGQDITSNVLGLCLQLDEGVHLKFEVKVPDQGVFDGADFRGALISSSQLGLASLKGAIMTAAQARDLLHERYGIVIAEDAN